MGEQDGVVSLWLGRVGTRAKLDALLKVEFSEDGNFLGSEFSRQFDIGYYDAGAIESEFRPDETASLSQFLRCASYSESIVGRFEALGAMDPAADCFVLLYNYRHEGAEERHGEGWTMRYFGTVSYRE